MTHISSTNVSQEYISIVKRVARFVAPRFTIRRLVLLAIRSGWRHPGELLHRLSSVNFHNHRVCRSLTIRCIVCGQEGRMFYDFPDNRLRLDHGIGLLRETLNCRSCGSTMRDRQMALGILDSVNFRLGSTLSNLPELVSSGIGGLKILDTDSFSSINKLMRHCSGYVHSQYVADRPNGEVLRDGSINVDLERMPFSGGNFDIILTSDVMEHVWDDLSAHREIYRCLATGGTYVFTVPYNGEAAGHRYLTVKTNHPPPASYFLLERHVHGDPHAESGILAHRIYGTQLRSDLEGLGFVPSFTVIDEPEAGIFGGDLFVAVKGNVGEHAVPAGPQ